MTTTQRRRQMDAPGAGDTIAGWRLVRRLPDDLSGRAQFVVVGEEREAASVASSHWHRYVDAAPATSLVERRAVVVPASEAGELLHECDVRDRLAGDFVARPIEVPATDQWRMAVYPLGYSVSYAEYVARGGTLEAGSIVTMLVPIAESIALAHRQGIAHGQLDLRSCCVIETGQPRLEAWHAALELDELSKLRRDLQVAADLRALGQIADALLSQCSASADAMLRQAVHRLRSGVADEQAADALIEALFRWAPASAIPPLADAAAAAEHLCAWQLGAAERFYGEVAELQAGDDEPLTLPPARKSWLLDTALERSRRLAAPIRPAIWLGVAAIGAAMALGSLVLIIPSAPAGSASSMTEAALTSPPAAAEIAAPPAQIETFGADTATDTASEHPEVSAASGETVAQLMQLRNDCLSSGDADCLDELYSADAPGLVVDVEAIAVGDGPTRRTDEQSWVLVNDLGDVELFRGDSGQASAAIIRDFDRGWLLREVWLSES